MPIISLYKKLVSPFNYQTLLFVFLAFIAVGLSLSPLITSIGGIGLSAVWLLNANFKQKLYYLKERKMIWPLLILFSLHIIWLLNTSNFNYALHDIKIKLPLLAIPLVLGSSPQLPNKKITNLFLIFIASVFISTLISTVVYLGFTNHQVSNIREISIIISHIRLGLMVLFSIILLIYFYYKTNLFLSIQKKLLLIAIISWFLLFIYILQSSTSWIIGIVILYFFIIKLQHQIKKRWPLLLIRLFLFVFPVLIAAFGIKVYSDFYHVKDDHAKLAKKTKYGNFYSNDTISQLLENGHYVNIQVSIKELRETWPTLSKIPLYGKDAKGQPMYGTLIRYLTSKGLTKDTDGLKSLSPEEIKLIESGVASCVYVEKSIFYIKVYEAIWEFDRYLNHEDPNAKSICMRVEYIKTAKHIISKNFWFGVGTGDVNDSYKQAYKEINSKLIEKYQKRAHNQYVTFFVTFGILGFIASLYSFISPYLAIKKPSILLTFFIMIIFLSMLNEDTLETQAGATFFAFFYPLLLIYSTNSENHG